MAYTVKTFNHFGWCFLNPLQKSVVLLIFLIFQWWSLCMVGETGACSVMGHILSVGLSRKPSSVGTLLLHKICLSLLMMVWYYQNINIRMTRFIKIWKVCFLWKSKLPQVNKVLLCDCLAKLIVPLTTVTGSHECLEYHALHYCAQIAQLFCKKWNIAIFIRWGWLCHPIWGQVLSLDSLSYCL